MPIKRRLNNNPVGLKYKALKGLEKGMTNKDVASKYDVPKNTLSTWVKNKHKLTNSLEKEGMSSSQKSTCYGSYDQIDEAVFHWFLGKRSQKVSIDRIIDHSLRICKNLLGLGSLKHRIVGSISGRKGINITAAFICPLLCYVEFFYKEFPPIFSGLRSSTCQELVFRPRR